MPTPPAYTPTWYTIGGFQPNPIVSGNFWTWAQVRSSMQLTATPGSFAWGVASHAIEYPTLVGGAADTNGSIFRGIPYGIDGNFYTEPEPPPSTDIKWYFFWGGFYESPPGSGIYIQGIGAGLDENEIGGILDGANVTCQFAGFTTNASARDASGVGQYIASYPAGDPGPGNFVSVTSP